MSVLSSREKTLLENALIDRKAYLEKELSSQHIFAEVKSPEVTGPSETSFDELTTDIDHELIKHQQDELEDIKMAISRMEKGNYGVCMDCGKPIGIERLKVYPMARRCIDCKRTYEKSAL